MFFEDEGLAECVLEEQKSLNQGKQWRAWGRELGRALGKVGWALGPLPGSWPGALWRQVGELSLESPV